MSGDLPLMLSANPLIAVAEGLLTSNACNHLIAEARTRLRRAQIGSDEAITETSDARTNSDAQLPPDDPIAADLMRRIARILGMPTDHGEGPSVLHYSRGQEFAPHVDGIWSGASADAQAAFHADGGQRLFTAILYLNAVAKGGATVFPKLELRVPPEPGRLLLFANTRAGDADATARALHAGEAVEEGEKWVAVSWWRERPFGAASADPDKQAAKTDDATAIQTP